MGGVFLVCIVSGVIVREVIVTYYFCTHFDMTSEAEDGSHEVVLGLKMISWMS